MKIQFSGFILTLLLVALPNSQNCLAKAKSVEKVKPQPLTLEAQCGMPFTDNAVLQQLIPVPVWGTSLSGAKVSVTFNGKTKKTVANGDGKWKVTLDPMKAVKLKSVNEVPVGKTMIITCEKDGKKKVKEVKNIVLGEVWVSAGQSNMAGSMRTIYVKENGKVNTEGLVKPTKLKYYPKDTITSANYPALRQMASGKSKPWLVCSPQSLLGFKKVAYFFGRRLQREILVPVGLIPAAVGGSKIETWLNQEPYPTGGNYSKHITPILGYGIRGVLWYQGESNERDGRLYQPKLESLINGWRKIWGQGDFPVYYVQLPGIGVSPKDNPAMGDGRAEIRQAYVENLTLPNTGMAVTIDIGAIHEHPPNKYDTGLRLANLALRHDYGFDNIPLCPLYKSYKVEGSAIRITFENAENGFMLAKKEDRKPPTPVPDGTLGWLSIQGKDGKWHWAEGKIDGSELLVSSKEVKEPVAVRYAYTNNPTPPLLYSKKGLPVGPFSTNGYGKAPEPEKKK